MKLHEINLYKLHANPETLKGHDKAIEMLKQKFNWLYLIAGANYSDIISNNTTIPEMFKHAEFDWNWAFAEQYTDQNFEHAYIDNITEETIQELYHKLKFTPKTIVSCNGEDYDAFFLVDAPVAVVEMGMHPK